MNLAEAFHQRILDQLRALRETQMEAVETAAQWFHETLCDERWIYVFGTGHSHLLAEELFFRAGGLVRIIPILHPPLMLHLSASNSTNMERDPSATLELLAKYRIDRGDLLVVASNSGRNAVPIELALRARDRGARIIALVNARHSARFPSRHESGKRLGDVADLVLDNCGVPGDASVEVDPKTPDVGATSTILGCTILQMIACRTVEKQRAAGRHPELFQSSNAGGDDANEALLRRYRQGIPHL